MKYIRTVYKLKSFLNALRFTHYHDHERSTIASERIWIYAHLSLSSHPSSTSISKHWEAELAALKGNNAKLTAALLESTANVKQWKQQLAAYQEEAERLHKRVNLAAARIEGWLSWESSFLCKLKVWGVCVPGDRAGVCERPNNSDQIPKDRTQPNNRGAGVSSEGQGGGTRATVDPRKEFHTCRLLSFDCLLFVGLFSGTGET